MYNYGLFIGYYTSPKVVGVVLHKYTCTCTCVHVSYVLVHGSISILIAVLYTCTCTCTCIYLRNILYSKKVSFNLYMYIQRAH